MVKAFAGILLRSVAGLAAGFFLALIVLQFAGQLSSGPPVTQAAIDQQTASLWLAFYIGSGVAVVAAAVGSRQISVFWLRFIVSFGAICFIPIWPSKSGLLPLGTPYVNHGFQVFDAVVLLIHIASALTLAAILHWLWPYLDDRFGSISRMTLRSR